MENSVYQIAIQPGTVTRLKVPVRNVSPEPQKLAGGSSSCSCVATGAFPLAIPGHSVQIVDVDVHANSRDAGRTFEYRLTLFPDGFDPIELLIRASVEADVPKDDGEESH